MKRVFILLLCIAAAACGVATTGDKGSSFKLGGISYSRDWIGALTLNDASVSGSGIVVATEPVSGSASGSAGFRLEGVVPYGSLAKLALVAFASKDGKGLARGTQVSVERDATEASYLVVSDQRGELCRVLYPLLEERAKLVIDIHEGGSEIFVWNSSAGHYDEDEAVLNTNICTRGRRAPVKGSGLAWGIELRSAELLPATTLTTPFLKHEH